jgi:hypothetical protein
MVGAVLVGDDADASLRSKVEGLRAFAFARLRTTCTRSFET